MTSKKTYIGILFILLIALAGVSQLAGQPAILFVETESMSPTIETNDGFIAIPKVIADDPEPDDIVVFEAQEIGGGGITTHRVVDVTDDGRYVTKGDNNPFTDQSGDEPLVTESQIKSVVPQPLGSPIIIPNLGLVIQKISSVGDIVGVNGVTPILAITIGIIILIYSLFKDPDDDTVRSRSKRRVKNNPIIFVITITLLLLIPFNASMLISSGIYEYEILSSESPVQGNPNIVPPDTKTNVTYTMINNGYTPFVIYLESDSPGVEITENVHYVNPNSKKDTTIYITSPEDLGRSVKYIDTSWYIPVLPPFMINYLHKIQPILAYSFLNIALGGFSTLISFILIGRNNVKLRTRKRDAGGFIQKVKNKTPLSILFKD